MDEADRARLATIKKRPVIKHTPDELVAPVWEQQTQIGETTQSYRMFLNYASLAPGERNILASWRKWMDTYNPKGITSKGMSTSYYNTAVSFLWEERAAARDIQQMRERYAEWSKRDWVWREESWRAGTKLYDKALQALDKLAESDVDLKPLEIAQLLKLANELRTSAIPTIGSLNTAQIRNVLDAIPQDKREAVIKIVMSEVRQTRDQDMPPIQLEDGNTVDGEIVEEAANG